MAAAILTEEMPRNKSPKIRRKRSLLRRILYGLAVAIVGLYLACCAILVMLKWIDPPTTMVQIQRRLQATVRKQPYAKRYAFVPLRRISLDLQHAVIASEDERFYQHHGIDWIELRKVASKEIENGKLGRGASTITQQLVKNLFLTTGRSVVRKAFEFVLAPTADFILGKARTLELYLNVIEWGPGIYGAEAASGNYYRIPAARLDRDQAARLAAVIPSPLTRKPARMDDLSADIEVKMRLMGW